MEDRFKFRVFDYDENKMVYFSSLIGIEKPHHDRSSKPNLYNDYVYHKISNYMQSTGLKDINGKLIFEGDILKFYSQSIIDAMAGEPLKERIGVAVWNEEELKFDVSVDNGKNVVPNLCKKTDDNNFEIIGNTYENKELLEEQK